MLPIGPNFHSSVYPSSVGRDYLPTVEGLNNSLLAQFVRAGRVDYQGGPNATE